MPKKYLYTGLIAAIAVAGIVWGVAMALQRKGTDKNPLEPDAEVVKEAESVIESRKKHDATVWSPEVTAQR